MLNLIAGEGQTNVLRLNSIDFYRWNEDISDRDWTDNFNEGWKKLRKLRCGKDNDQFYNFDVLMANPPFAGDIKESRIIAKYELGKYAKVKQQSKVGRDILFIKMR